jgi:hypothetical protein
LRDTWFDLSGTQRNKPGKKGMKPRCNTGLSAVQ